MKHRALADHHIVTDAAAGRNHCARLDHGTRGDTAALANAAGRRRFSRQSGKNFGKSQIRIVNNNAGLTGELNAWRHDQRRGPASGDLSQKFFIRQKRNLAGLSAINRSDRVYFDPRVADKSTANQFRQFSNFDPTPVHNYFPLLYTLSYSLMT
jgi:hypothetical protein